MTTTLCGEMRSFKPYPNERDSVKQTRERCKKPCNFEQKIPTKILSHYPLVLPSQKIHDPRTFLQNLFPPKGSLVNAPQKKKRGKEKERKRGGEKAKGKRRKGSETFSKKNYLEILLSAHARTLKAGIWYQEQKLVQCSTCKRRFGQFGFFSARQRPKNGLTCFERHFLAKCPGVNGLKGWLNKHPMFPQGTCQNP